MLEILLIVCLMFLLSKTILNVSKIVFSFLFGCYVMKFINSVTTDASCLKVAHTHFCNYFLIKKYSKTCATYFLSFLIAVAYKPVNMSTPDQMLFQHFGSTLRSNVENETKSDVGFSTLYNVDTVAVYDVETTWHHVVSVLF